MGLYFAFQSKVLFRFLSAMTTAMYNQVQNNPTKQSTGQRQER